MAQNKHNSSDTSTEIRNKLNMAVPVAENAGFSVNMRVDEGLTAYDRRGEITLEQDTDTPVDVIVWQVKYDDTTIACTEYFQEAFEEFCDLVI
jgi:hypothetical protein